MRMNRRDKQILCGLFLSKFDRTALDFLGFAHFKEAFNALGYGLRARPASIKNYRDELDPFFPNNRKGWRNRPLREHCRRIYEQFHDAQLEEIGSLIKNFIDPSDGLDSLPIVSDVLRNREPDHDSTFAKRLITGNAAEKYFESYYETIEEFAGRSLVDTTQWGCGFDYKLEYRKGSDFRVAEIKGIREKSGAIMMTDLEHSMAEALRDLYFLVVVRNFVDQPFHTVFKDPLNSCLDLVRTERKELRISWSAKIPD